MEIHRYERLWFGLALLLIVGFIATITYGAVGAGVTMVDDSGGQVNPDDLSDHPKFGNPGVYAAGENRYDVYVVAQQFMFRPGTSEPLRLPVGSTVTFYVTSADVIHGFELAGTNANTMAIPGQVAEITVRFDETGTYGMVCHEYCGAGHHGMAGTVEIVPRSQFDESEVTS